MRELDESEESALVRESWEKLMSNVQIDDAMNEFLKRSIDDCGTEICFAAFKFVSNILDPTGFVRKIHKNENQNLSQVLQNPEGPWMERDKAVHWKADFQGTWNSSAGQNYLNNYMKNKFTGKKKNSRNAANVGVEHIDDSDDDDDDVDNGAKFPDKLPINFKRFVTETDSDAAGAKVKIYRPLTQANANLFCDKDTVATALERNERAVIRDDSGQKICDDPDVDIWVRPVKKLIKSEIPTETGQSPAIRRWEKVFTMTGALKSLQDKPNDPDLKQELKDETVPLEPWWIWDLHGLQNKTMPNSKKLISTDNLQYAVAFMGSKPDLMIEVGYNNSRSGRTQKCVIVSETDGSDKTAGAPATMEDSEKKRNVNNDPVKLAVKMMQSCAAQQALQKQTYNIRSNFYTYFKHRIEQSLFDTTNVHLPSFQETLTRLEVSAKGKVTNNTNDYTILSHATTLIHQMYIAHCKVAFSILMKQKHNIDLLDMDKKSRKKSAGLEQDRPQMLDNHFFINFDGFQIPQKLNFQHKTSPVVLDWLSQKKMLQARSKCKTWNTETNKVEYVRGPTMNASSIRSMLQDWTAAIDVTRLDDMGGLTISKSHTSAVPVVCATVQRVNMNRLCAHIVKAAQEAHAEYHQARILNKRTTQATTDSTTFECTRRLLPDRCFLTRKQQMDPDAHWNKQLRTRPQTWDPAYETPTRTRVFNNFVENEFDKDEARRAPVGLRSFNEDVSDDLIEHFFGYENPYLKRTQFNLSDVKDLSLSVIETCKWDQIDVRQHFFSRCMKKLPWQQYANGVWYYDDYIQFLDMLRSLKVGPERFTGSTCHFTCFDQNFAPNEKEQYLNANAQLNTIKKKCASLSKYTFQLHEVKNNYELDQDCQYLFYASMFQHDPEVYYDDGQPNSSMPEESEQQDKAHHIFSILSWFFDCRDGGACRFEWEDALCEYFGSNISTPHEASQFETFTFANRNAKIAKQYLYYNQPYFQMMFFLEHNFRNAVAPIHYKLWDMDKAKELIAADGLQAHARRIYQRQTQVFNNRQSFAGLHGVSRFLSFQKYSHVNLNLTLQERILSQLDDDLPTLDRSLKEYVRQFNIPDAELFLRVVRCPNVLALRELAQQHLSSTPADSMQKILKYFAPAVQSEIEVMLKFIQTDDSVYVQTPLPHPSKQLILQTTQLLTLVRRVLHVDSNCAFFETPLQFKYSMFAQQETFWPLRRLFCTRDIVSWNNKRPLKFILMQVAMMYDIMSSNKPVRANTMHDIFFFLKETLAPEPHYSFRVQLNEDGSDCVNPMVTVGSSLVSWPLRDMNFVCNTLPPKSESTAELLSMAQNADVKKAETDIDTVFESVDGIHFQGKTYELTPAEMKSRERNKWLLLMSSRPALARNRKYSDVKLPGFEGNMQVHIDKKLSSMRGDNYNVSLSLEDGIVAPCVHITVDDTQPMFLERMYKIDPPIEVSENEPEFVQVQKKLEQKLQVTLDDLPLFVQTVIPSIPNRKHIYIPSSLANLWLQNSSRKSNVFKHQIHINGKWEYYAWKRTYTGFCAWSWKRLMIKLIFIQSMTKLITRSELLLGLYHPPMLQQTAANFYEKIQKKYHVTTQLDLSQNLCKMHELTSKTFGNLEHKLKYIQHASKPTELNEKVELSIYLPFKRECEVDMNKIDIHTEYKKITSFQKQMNWLQHVLSLSNGHRHDEEFTNLCSFRYMRIQRQMFSLHTSTHSITHCEYDMTQMCFYGKKPTYLILKTPRKDKFLKMQEEFYIKFPDKYCLLRGGGHIKIETSNKSFEFNKQLPYAVTFNCRTYGRCKKSTVECKEMNEYLNDSFIDHWKKIFSCEQINANIFLKDTDDHYWRRSLDSVYQKDGLHWRLKFVNQPVVASLSSQLAVDTSNVLYQTQLPNVLYYAGGIGPDLSKHPVYKRTANSLYTLPDFFSYASEADNTLPCFKSIKNKSSFTRQITCNKEDAVDDEFFTVVNDEQTDCLKQLQEWNMLRTSCKNIAWKSSNGMCYQIEQVFEERNDFSYVQYLMNRIETLVISDASRKETRP